MPAAELVALDIEDVDPQTRLLVAIDKIEELSLKLADDRDEMQARLSAAAMFGRLAIASAEAALDVPYGCVYDHVIEALAHLRTLQTVLAGTPPEIREVPTQRRIRRNGMQ